jgi:enolase
MTSHRSGETESTYIADLAVALKTGYVDVAVHAETGG